MKKFLHTLGKTEGSGNYLVEDQIWKGTAFSEWDWLRMDRAGRELKVQFAYRGELFEWEYCKDLAPGINFSHRGTAATIEEACRAALEFVPESMILDYLGQSFTCYGAPRTDGARRWVFSVDGEAAEVLGPLERSGKEAGEYFLWERTWSPAALLLEKFCSNSSMRGWCPSVREAMIAAIDAPELFKRACAEMISTLHTTGGL
jgi:hypothetical protein